MRSLNKYSQRGSYMIWKINMGVCPRMEFDYIMFINCLGYDFYLTHLVSNVKTTSN